MINLSLLDLRRAQNVAILLCRLDSDMEVNTKQYKRPKEHG